ncbi:MAG: nodulation protein NfeD [Dehalococcoidia bacterium]|nr:nodulation protein NfeD [Dehalococcoidia bacterium]
MDEDSAPRPARGLRIGAALLALFLGGLIFACSGGPDAPPGAVHVLTTDGVVNPVMERYVDRGLDAAEEDEAALVVIRLDTPGGLLSSMNKIVKRILAARVPVAVYVWPAGAQAASAGTFITEAAPVAAMAPTSRIGAAHPVGSGGEEIEGPLNDKVTNDSVALIRSLAERYGRNADWAEDAVRESVSASATEAAALHVVDLVAPDLDDLLRSVDGRSVELDGRQRVTIRTAGAAVVYNNRNFIEDFLDIIADPNIAFLLLSLGSLALFIEIIHPGAIFPGVFGVISLLLGFFALSVLPFNWAGVALILFAFVLFGLEMFVTSQGILGIGGAVALVLGGLLLTSDNPPGFQVSPWLVFSLAAALAAFVVFVVVNIVRIRHMPALVGAETVVGRMAVARSALNPSGFVMLDGEYWQAEVEDGEVQAGEQVVITEISGLKLKVRKPQPEGE